MNEATASKGYSYSGDVYIVLKTDEANGVVKSDIHTWTGSKASQVRLCYAYATGYLSSQKVMITLEPIQASGSGFGNLIQVT